MKPLVLQTNNANVGPETMGNRTALLAVVRNKLLLATFAQTNP